MQQFGLVLVTHHLNLYHRQLLLLAEHLNQPKNSVIKLTKIIKYESFKSSHFNNIPQQF